MIRYRKKSVKSKDIFVKKLDKETIIVIILCALLWLGWGPFCRWMGWVKPAEPLPTPTQTVETTQTEQQQTTQTSETQTQSTSSQSVTPKTSDVKFISGRKIEIPIGMNPPLRQIVNDYINITVNPAYGEVVNINFPQILHANHQDILSCQTVFGHNIGTLGVYGDQIWQVLEIVEDNQPTPQSYRLSRRILIAGSEIILTQSWELTGNYGLNYQVELKNTGNELTFQTLTISGGIIKPFSYMAGDRVRGESYTLDYMTIDGKANDIKVNVSAKNEAKFQFKPELPLKWVGLGNKFFINVLVAEKPFDTMRQFREAKAPTVDEIAIAGKGAYYVAEVDGVYNGFKLAGGQSENLNFKFYFGPKIKSEVDAFDSSVSHTIRLMSWKPMNALAKFMLWALISLKSFCGSYGWAIIILTAIVRILLWPVTHKANMAMKRMQLYKPEMDAIRSQYKDDSQTMNMKMMELYKKEGINPMRGCLPLFLQLPIFMALYFSLDAAVELRHVAFWWAADLSQPDTVFTLFGLPINPLVIVMTGLMLFQQRLMPAAGDPMQQKMMMIMPIVMLFILYNLPSGLTLYWTVSQIFSILQMLLTQKLAGNNLKNKTAKA